MDEYYWGWNQGTGGTFDAVLLATTGPERLTYAKLIEEVAQEMAKRGESFAFVVRKLATPSDTARAESRGCSG